MSGNPSRPGRESEETAPTLAGANGEIAPRSRPGEPSSEESNPAVTSTADTDVALARTAPLPRPTGGPGADSVPADALPPGSRLGTRYTILRSLGLGGMGAVYLAHDQVLGKDLALKVLRPKLADRLGVGALRDEVLLAQKVTHPNVCRIYDLEEVAGVYLVKMEYVDGETLSQRMDRGAVEVGEAVRIGKGIAAGLDAAHREGVIHRDLKPQNVMVEAATGRVVLMDFGLARSAGPEGGGADATVSGTPEYMSPEQARGEKLDGRADLYALGALLYHLVVGQLPFPQARALLRQGRTVSQPASDPRARRPDLPPWLGRLILRLLEKDRVRRPSDARTVGRLLDGPRYLRVAVLAAIGAIAIAATAAGVRGIDSAQRARAAWHPHVVELPAWEENADMPSFSPDGTMLAYLSDRDGAWRIYVELLAGSDSDRSSRAITPAREGGAPLDPDLPRWSRDGKGLFFVGSNDRAFRVGLDGSPPRPFASGVKRVDECGPDRLAVVLASSPGCARCERLVLRPGSANGALAAEGMAAAAGERELLQLPVDQAIDFLRCDPSGERIVFTRSPVEMHTVQHPGDIYVVSTSSGAPVRLTDERERNRYPSYPTFAPDGRSIVFSSARAGPTNLWEMPVTAGGTAMPLTGGEGPDLAPAISFDGTRLVYDVDITAVPIFAVPMGEGVGGAPGQRRRIAPSLDDAASLVATPDGTTVIASVRRHGKPKIVAIPLGEGGERALADGDTPALSADGAELVYSTSENERGALFRLPLTFAGQPTTAKLVAQFDGHVASLAVGPDGVLHFARARDRAVEAWRVAPGGSPPEPDAPAPVTQIVPAPRGGFRIAILAIESGPSARVVPPGHAVDEVGLRTVPLSLCAWDASGETFVYWDGTSAHRQTAASGEDRLLFAEKDLEGLAVSPDGKTLYLSTPVGHVRRHLIDNFATRPR